MDVTEFAGGLSDQFQENEMTLKEARFKKGMTQYELWRLTGITAPRISLAERGFVFLKKREREVIACALGVPTEQIEWPEPWKDEFNG